MDAKLCDRMVYLLGNDALTNCEPLHGRTDSGNDTDSLVA